MKYYCHCIVTPNFVDSKQESIRIYSRELQRRQVSVWRLWSSVSQLTHDHPSSRGALLLIIDVLKNARNS